MVERQQAWYFGVLLHLDKLLCSAFVFRLLRKWQVHVISLGMCPTTFKQLFRCTATVYLSCSCTATAYLSCSHCPPRKMPQTAHQRMQGLPMRLYTWWPRTLHLTTNWLLGVAVVLGLSAMFRSLFSGSEMASSGSTITIVSRANTRAAHLFVLYGY